MRGDDGDVFRKDLIPQPVVIMGVADDDAAYWASSQVFGCAPQVVCGYGRLEGVKDQRSVAQIDDAGVAVSRPTFYCDGGVHTFSDLMERKVV